MIFSDTLSGDVIFLENFSQTVCHHKKGIYFTWVVFTDKHFYPHNHSLDVYNRLLKRKKMIDSSSYGWSFFEHSISDIKWWVTLALLQSSCYKLYVLFGNFSYTNMTQKSSLKRNKKTTGEYCGTQISRSIFWQHRSRCSIGTLHFTQSPIFSTTSQTLPSLPLQFSEMTIETWLHLCLTTARWFWTINHSWKLKILPLQVTS